jgi:hypothetical protein
MTQIGPNPIVLENQVIVDAATPVAMLIRQDLPRSLRFYSS